MNALHLSISVASWALPWDADAPRKGAYTLFNPTPREARPHAGRGLARPRQRDQILQKEATP